MKAVVIHHTLNAQGGEAAVAIETLQSLHDLGYEVYLITIQKPNLRNIYTLYGKTLPFVKIISLFPFKVSYFGIYQRLLTTLHSLKLKDPDILINTNGGMMPRNIPVNTSIMTYVHFPPSLLTTSNYRNSKYTQSLFWKTYFKPYQKISDILIKRSLSKSKVIVTNSNFTKEAITKAYPETEPIVLYPPVNIKKFDVAYESNSNGRQVLVISRFSPEKQIENAIKIANILRKDDIKFKIIGSVIPSNLYYFNSIKRMVNDLGLSDKVSLIKNGSFIEMLNAMSDSRVYLHPMRGEHFGVSVVEAMGAGLVPIVPAYGGCSELVPKECHYNSLEEGAQCILRTLDNYTSNTKKQVHDHAENYSSDVFRKRMQRCIEETQAVKIPIRQ